LDADFLSGSRGAHTGRRAALEDLLLDARALATARGARLARATRRSPPRRRVLVLGVERTDAPGLMAQARAELARSRHDVEIAIGAAGDQGKFENLNALLTAHPAAGHDWLLLIDDDVALPRGFLDAFLFLAERFDLKLAQPAHRRRSHAAWEVTRRVGGSVVRETAFVEIGPVLALHADTFATLLPFPPLRTGWGLDLHWSALARAHGWPQGVVDAVAVSHLLRPIAVSYASEHAIDEGRAFLADRPYTPRDEAQRTLVRHARW